MPSINTIIFSLLGGVLPALIWLWFWLREDKRHPEPKSRIFLSFLCGMLAVWPAIEMERYLCRIIDPYVCTGEVAAGPLLILLWAATEEIFKYILAFVSSFWKNRHNNEPIDPIIYMITVALGFSALENALFIFDLVDMKLFVQSVLTGNSRFLGATLLHVASSASVGVMMGLSYYKKPATRKIFLFTGIGLSVLLHAVFNSLIIKFGNGRFFIFAGVWALLIVLLVLFEKVKQMKIKKS